MANMTKGNKEKLIKEWFALLDYVSDFPDWSAVDINDAASVGTLNSLHTFMSQKRNTIRSQIAITYPNRDVEERCHTFPTKKHPLHLMPVSKHDLLGMDLRAIHREFNARCAYTRSLALDILDMYPEDEEVIHKLDAVLLAMRVQLISVNDIWNTHRRNKLTGRYDV